MRLIPRQRRSTAHNLPGGRLRTVLVLSLLAAVVTAAALFSAGWHLLGVEGLKPEAELSSKTLFDLVKISFGVVAGAGALVALVVAYRKQRVNEADALREATRLHTERFTAAVTQLGEVSSAVRLGGVHALAGLADDAPTDDLRQTCIDVLCAYLRLPYAAERDLHEGDAEAWHQYLALREVRHTIVRVVRDHLRRPSGDPHSWQGHDFDFTNVVFDGGTVDFTGAYFQDGTINFAGADFSSGTLDLSGAKFASGTVSFRRADFTGGTLDFSAAEFGSGTVDFSGAGFSGSTIHFDWVEFSGGTVDFTNTRGDAPANLALPGGLGLPDGLMLPAEWLPPSALEVPIDPM